MHAESCRATRVRREQSDEALELRTACLEDRRRELAAFVAAYATAVVETPRDADDFATAQEDLQQRRRSEQRSGIRRHDHRKHARLHSLTWAASPPLDRPERRSD